MWHHMLQVQAQVDLEKWAYKQVVSKGKGQQWPVTFLCRDQIFAVNQF